MQSYFEINVSKDGKHYFATSPRSLTDRSAAWSALEDFRKRFPAEEGFFVTMVYWDCKGTFCS
jgi:hypothetical protein